MLVSGTLEISGAWQLSGNALTIPEKATTPSPANEGVHADKNPTLSWQNGGGALVYDVYVDTFNPPTTLRSEDQAGTTFDATVDYGTEFFWRVNAKNNSGTTTGDVWSATTMSIFEVDGYSSFDVGGDDGDELTTDKLDTGTPLSLGVWAMDTLAATAIKAGGTYEIVTVGTSDFTAVGAADNNVGTEFVATGAATGTGTLTVPRKYVSDEPMPLYSPMKNGATEYLGDEAATAIKFGMDTWINTATLTLTTPVSSFTMGFWLKFGPPASTNPDAPDLIQIRHNTGGWVVLGWHPTGNYFYFEAGPSGTSSQIASITHSTWYWVTIQGGENGVAGQNHICKVYAADGVTLIGTATFDCSGNTEGVFNAVQIGRLDNHSASNQPPSTSYITFSQMGINTSTLTYPLGP